uniref:Ubiquitin-conjugating enzyme E2-18 kDa n=1 Tax=Graphocephala atropunctata TaxID=36148 RepID=A0A1B6M388_9HEMI
MSVANLHRIQKELSQIRNSNDKFKNVQVEDSDMFVWNGVLYPINPPYNRGAFKIKMVFPKEYPFKPPTLQFITKIYHPNIDEDGAVCLSIVNPEMWKPATKVTNIVEALVQLIDEPEPDHPLRADIAELYIKDRKKFLKNADEFTRKNGEKRCYASTQHHNC